MNYPINDTVLIIVTWMAISAALAVLGLWFGMRILKGETLYEEARRQIILRSSLHFRRKPKKWNDLSMLHLGYPIGQRYRFVTLYIFGLNPYRVFDYWRLHLLGRAKPKMKWWFSQESWMRKPSKQWIEYCGNRVSTMSPNFIVYGRRDAVCYNVVLNNFGYVSVGLPARVTRAGRAYLIFPVVCK